MSDYKIVDTQFDRAQHGVSLTQIIHAPIRQPSGEVKTFILSAHIQRGKSDKYGWRLAQSQRWILTLRAGAALWVSAMRKSFTRFHRRRTVALTIRPRSKLSPLGCSNELSASSPSLTDFSQNDPLIG